MSFNTPPKALDHLAMRYGGRVDCDTGDALDATPSGFQSFACRGHRLRAADESGRGQACFCADDALAHVLDDVGRHRLCPDGAPTTACVQVLPPVRKATAGRR